MQLRGATSKVDRQVYLVGLLAITKPYIKRGLGPYYVDIRGPPPAGLLSILHIMGKMVDFGVRWTASGMEALVPDLAAWLAELWRDGFSLILVAVSCLAPAPLWLFFSK